MLIRPVADASTGDAFGNFALNSQRAAVFKRSEGIVGRDSLAVIKDAWFSAAERHRPDFAVTVNFDIETFRKCIHYRGANTVKST